jgi:Domain of unknown function (DUF1833)
MSNYSEFFLNTSSQVVELELLEIYHPSFSKTYYIVRNATNGLTVTLEDSSVKTFDYYPVQIDRSGATDNLDQTLKITLGDLGEIVPLELDAVAAAGTFLTLPTCKFRTYRSDVLSAPIYGPINYTIRNLSSNKEGTTFEAIAPHLNVVATGEVYDMTRFPMLKGFL